MQTSTAITTGESRSRVSLGSVWMLACVLAVAFGGVATTDQGVLVVGAMIGLVVCGVGVAIYVRDPLLALIWLFLFEVFNGPLSAAVGYSSSAGQGVRQADEVLVLLLVGLTVWRAMRTNTKLPPIRFILPGIVIGLLGLLGAVTHHVPMAVAIIGLWLGLKFWTMTGISLMLPWKVEDLGRIYTVLTRVGVFVAAFGLVDYLSHGGLSHTLHTSIYHEARGYRGEAVGSIFPHPGEYSLFMSLLFALTFARFGANRSKPDLVLAMIFAGSVLLSLRLKGFLSLVAVVIIVALVQSIASNRGSITILLAGALLLVGIYSIEGNVIAKQISTYTSSETTARGRLYGTGEQIAKENFPLGVGFGRFASYPSRLFYSPVYYQYDLGSVYGLEPTGADFIDDTSWPTVIGEVGYGGLVAYLLGIILIIFAIIKRLRTTADDLKWLPLAALCAMAVILVDSLGNSTLFDWLATTTFAMILGLAMAVGRDRVGGASDMRSRAGVGAGGLSWRSSRSRAVISDA